MTAVDPAQLLHQALPAGRAEAGDVVEHALRHALAAQLAVEGDGEAVGLVADALEQVERLGLAGHADGVGLAGQVTSSNRLASDATGISSSRPSSSSTRTATLSWPLPPSTSSSWGG